MLGFSHQKTRMFGSFTWSLPEASAWLVPHSRELSRRGREPQCQEVLASRPGLPCGTGDLLSGAVSQENSHRCR